MIPDVHFTGVHFIPVINCIAPAPSRLLRKVDRLFVEGLKQNMCEDPTAPGRSHIYIVQWNFVKRTTVNILEFMGIQTVYGYACIRMCIRS